MKANYILVILVDDLGCRAAQRLASIAKSHGGKSATQPSTWSWQATYKRYDALCAKIQAVLDDIGCFQEQGPWKWQRMPAQQYGAMRWILSRKKRKLGAGQALRKTPSR